MQAHDQDWDVNMAYFSNQVDEPDPYVTAVVQALKTFTVVPVMTQTPAVISVPVSVLPTTTNTGHPQPTTRWPTTYPGSTRRSKHQTWTVKETSASNGIQSLPNALPRR
jgi:hypothetical protein